MDNQKNKNELITEVDEKDNVLGLRSRSDFNNGNYIHRSSYLLLFDQKERILLQKRSMKKKWHPGKYTYPVAGTVANETYKECIQREIKEAFGKPLKFHKLFNYKHFDEVDKAFKRVFAAKVVSSDIECNSSYADSFQWITLDKLKKELEEDPQKFAPPFLPGIRIFFKDYRKWQVPDP